MVSNSFGAPEIGLVTPIAGQPEKMVLMISPVCSGATLMLRAFAQAGYTSVAHPLKTALRWHHLGETRPWSIPTQGALFVAESFGPYHRFEVEYDPLRACLASGLDPERLSLVVLLRDPVEVWASWQSIWGNLARIEHLQSAYAMCRSTVQSARSLGCAVHATHHRSCAVATEKTMARLFQSLGHDMAFGLADLVPACQDDSTRAPGVVRPIRPPRYDYLSDKPQSDLPCDTAPGQGVTERHRQDIAATIIPDHMRALARALADRPQI